MSQTSSQTSPNDVNATEPFDQETPNDLQLTDLQIVDDHPSTTTPPTATITVQTPVKTTTFGVEVCQPIGSGSHHPSADPSLILQPGPSGLGANQNPADLPAAAAANAADSSSISDTSSAAGFKQPHYHTHLLQSPSRLTAFDHGGTHLEIQTLRHSSDKSNEKRYQCVPATAGAGMAHNSAGSVESDHSIECLDSLLPPIPDIPVDDPIIIRGNGNMTLFGLSNSFSNTFPSSLLGRVSREEFEHSMNCINHLLQQQHSTNAKFLLLGCLCCCCSLGCSLLWPTVALSKRTRNSLDKLLAMENSRLYNKLGLNWHLSKQQCHTNHSFMEYILVIDFLPKLQIYQPD